MPCHVPSARRPAATGRVSDGPISDALTWAGMSSAPSSVCDQAKSSGTNALAHTSKSRRTSGEAFSLRVNEALVCRMCRCSRPTVTSPSSGTAATTSRVTRWKPRGRGSRENSRCVHIADLRALDVLVVAHGVLELEVHLQSLAVGRALGRAELALVG